MLRARGWRSGTGRTVGVELAVLTLAALDVVLSAHPRWNSAFALSGLSCAVLPLRHRWPRIALALTLPGLLAGYALFAVMVAVYAVAVRHPGWQAWAGSALAALGYFIPWPPSDFAKDSARELMQAALWSALSGATPSAFGLLVRTRAELSARLRELASTRRRETALYAETVLARGLAKERARIAREMHDIVSSQVTLIALHAQALRVADPAQTRGVAGTIYDLSSRTLEELRELVGALRLGGGDDLRPRLATLPDLVAASAAAVRLRVDPLPDALPEPVEQAAYRTVQEGLTNMRKHAAGAAGEVTVGWDGTALTVLVRNGPADRPVAPAVPGGGHGLAGLRERAALLGGTLHAGPTGDGGFEVRAAFPVVRCDAEPQSSGSSAASSA
ncbi:MAG: sensor histidine kinase [Mycobacteriales bacterium]